MSLNKLFTDSEVRPRIDASLNSLKMSQVGVAADLSLDSSYSNKTIFLDSSAPRTITIPEISASNAGLQFKFVVSANGQISDINIANPAGGANILGHIIQLNAGTNADIIACPVGGGGNNSTVRIIGTAAVGDTIELVYSTGFVYANIITRINGGITTV